MLGPMREAWMPIDDISLLLIAKKMAGNFGLAPSKWREQRATIRCLPEVDDARRL